MGKGRIRLLILWIGVAALACLCLACSAESISSTAKTEPTTVIATTDQTIPIETINKTEGETSIPISTSSISIITPPAGSIRPVTQKDIIAIFDELGLTIKDFAPTDGLRKEFIAAYDSESKYYYRYEVFSFEEKAKEYFEEVHKLILKDDNKQTIDGTCDVFEKDGYTLMIGSGMYGEVPLYEVVLLVDDTVITGFVWSIEEIDKQMINNVFIGLGYM